jgi:hypothetical protein
MIPGLDDMYAAETGGEGVAIYCDNCGQQIIKADTLNMGDIIVEVAGHIRKHREESQ